MNARALVLISTLIAVAGAGRAQQSTPGYVPMKILQTDGVIFPNSVHRLGITSGIAQVAVQVDREGRLADHLVTAYSHEAFANAAVVAIKKWKYEPAWIEGDPVSAIMELTFNFERQGLVVVDMTVSSYVEMRNYQLRPTAYSYSAATMRELDRIPTPTKVVRPLYPIEEKKPPQSAKVVVTFFIDENGRVRMPAVTRQTNETLGAFAAAAVDAVSQWEFEPPTARGRPVLVAAQQEFNFTPGTEGAR